MRIALIAMLSIACAHNLRAGDPENWLELRSEHFILRTDLSAEEARASIGRLEQQRAALLATGFREARETAETTVVVELASQAELGQFALREVEGYSGRDAFGQPLIVMSNGGGRVATHELTHVLVSEMLVTQPLWIHEGLAAYMETLRFENGQVVRGESRRERLDWLQKHPVHYFDGVIGAAGDSLGSSAGAVSSFQSAAWLLVHWMIDRRPHAFAALLARLQRGENPWVAFDAEFPDLHERELQSELGEYLKAPDARVVSRFPMPRWNGSAQAHAISRAEVYATRAELFREAPPEAALPDRAARIRAELVRALIDDPGNPLALRLLGGVDPTPAIRLHPEDWRSWVLYSDSTGEHWAIEQAARLAPRNPGVLYRLAVSSHNDGDGAEALAEADRALAVGGTRPDVLDAVAQIYAGNGRCEEARNLEDRAMNSQPDSTSAEVAGVLPVQASAHRCDASWAPHRQERSPRLFQAARMPRDDDSEVPASVRLAHPD